MVGPLTTSSGPLNAPFRSRPPLFLAALEATGDDATKEFRQGSEATLVFPFLFFPLQAVDPILVGRIVLGRFPARCAVPRSAATLGFTASGALLATATEHEYRGERATQ